MLKEHPKWPVDRSTISTVTSLFLKPFFFSHSVKLLSEIPSSSLCASLCISVMRQSFAGIGANKISSCLHFRERISLAESKFVQNADDVSSVLDDIT